MKHKQFALGEAMRHPLHPTLVIVWKSLRTKRKNRRTALRWLKTVYYWTISIWVILFRELSPSAGGDAFFCFNTQILWYWV